MNNVILTSYFTTKPDPQRGTQWNPNDFKLISGWIDTLNALGLRGIIFHDEPIGDCHGLIECRQYTLRSYLWSVNDERFLCWLEYLENHPEIDNVFFTDLFDVTFNRDPFDLITNDYDLYVGCGAGFPKKIGANKWLCNKMLSAYGQVYHAEQCTVNAGVIGGTRENIMALAAYMVDEFRRLNSPDNINMAVFNRAVYDLFGSARVLIGPPVTSLFKKYEQSGDFAIRHK